MKCPSCSKKIDMFSKELNTWDKKKFCPHCNTPLKTKVNIKKAFLYAIPLMTTTVLINVFFFGETYLEHFITGIGGGFIVLLSMELIKYEDSQETE